MGYSTKGLPTLTISSSNTQAHGASIFVPGILGAGATFSVAVDRVGSVTTIKVVDYGEDYIEKPNVSLRVQDIVISNVSISNLPKKQDRLYQGGTINTASYIASVNSVSILAYDNDPAKSLYNLRVYNYNSNPKPQLPLKIENNPSIVYLMANSAFDANTFYPEIGRAHV